MRLHRFYINETVGSGNDIQIHSAETVHQIKHVFRSKVGDSIIVFDGKGSDFQCKISDMTKDKVVLSIDLTMRSPFNPPKRVLLFASIVKKDNFEWIVEKATELGVTDIIPVISERSEKKSLNARRLEKIAIEASEQSGRGTVPQIGGILGLEEAIKSFLPSIEPEVSPIAFHTEGEKFDMKEIKDKACVAIFIGPEGGWSDAELDLFHRNGIDVRCLGGQVLRAETAVVAAVSQIVFA